MKIIEIFKLIDAHRKSENLFWQCLVFIKDIGWKVKNLWWLMDAFIKGFLIRCLNQKMDRPNFLGIGVHKCATTWLFEMLKKHPDIFMPPHKELHYFDWYLDKSLIWYFSYFVNVKRKIKGEMTANYSVISISRIRLIKWLMPDVRLILMLRNPVERAWSHALVDFIDIQKRNYHDITDQEFYAHFNSYESRCRGDYLSCLNKWLSVFPKDQLFIGYFDDVLNNPVQLIKDVLLHIQAQDQLDWSTMVFHKKVNSGPGIPIPDKYLRYLQKIYAQEIEILYRRLNHPIVNGWRINQSCEVG